VAIVWIFGRSLELHEEGRLHAPHIDIRGQESIIPLFELPNRYVHTIV